jgi:heptosyltransferase-2
MENPKRILVRSPNWIGDQILAYPFFHYLREMYPSAHIAVACVPWVQAVQFRNLVDEVLVLPRPLKNTFFSKWDAVGNGAKMLRELGPWDLGICLPNSFSTAWLLFRAKVKVRRGYSADSRRFLLTEALPWETKPIRHRADAYMGLLPPSEKDRVPALEFWGVPSANDLDPSIPGVVKEFDAAKAWPDADPIEPLNEPYWILAPGTTAESRRWSTGAFAAFARKVAEEKKWTGIIIGGAAETKVAARLAEEPGLHLLDWTGKGTPSSYWKVFKNSKFSLCNDSGLAHVASLCGSPVQIAWGGGNPARTEPIGPGKVQVTFNPVECWPCEQNSCTQIPTRKLECLRGVTPEAVWNEVKSGIRP